MTRDILLVTNIWNERERIPRLFEAVSKQTILPKLWVWFDDGSTDESAALISELAKEYPVPIKIFSMPKKDKGNLDTIGHCYARFMPKLYRFDFDYMTILDVDSYPHADFFETQCRLLECNPDAGISGGQTDKDPPRTHMIMGGGMFIRWDLVRRIRRWWPFSPDSMFNVLAIFAGYARLLVNDLVIPAALSISFRTETQFRVGRYAILRGDSRFLVLRRFQGYLRRRGAKAAVYYAAGILVELSRSYRLNYKEITAFYGNRVKHKYLRSETLAEALYT